MKLFSKILSFLIVLVFFSSCASIVSKNTWPLIINTNPNGARAEITDRHGITVYSGSTPLTIKLKSGAGFFLKQSYQLKLTLDGYQTKIIPLECTINGWYFGNLFFGGLLGLLIIDPATGAMYRLDVEYINETLVKEESTAQKTLKIIDINTLSDSMKQHLVCIK